jgi:GDP-L-fucose synthase
MKTKVYVAGHSGMVGSAICRQLDKDYSHIITRSHSELDLTNQLEVSNFFKIEKLDEVYIAAGKVGGIYANSTYPADFIYDNIMIQSNIINSAFRNGVKKILFLGSSSIYPKLSSQPIHEELLMTGSLESSNEAYSIAKIAGIKMCESYNIQYGKKLGLSYRSLMPTNLYGVGDSYHLQNSHVIPALIRKVHEAKLNNETLTVWGSGNARREFLYVDDLAAASIFTMKLDNIKYDEAINQNCSHLNAGFGDDVSIKTLVKAITAVVGYSGKVIFDDSKPEGVQRKLLDSSKLNDLGWASSVSLKDGLEVTYRDFIKNIKL